MELASSKTVWNGWGKLESEKNSNTTQDLNEIMSEQLALELWQSENVIAGEDEVNPRNDCDGDERFARMIQLHDEEIAALQQLNEDDLEEDDIEHDYKLDDPSTICQWSNKVCKSTKSNSRSRLDRRQLNNRVEESVSNIALEAYSQKHLSKLVQSGVLAEIVCKIEDGKKSTVLLAKGGSYENNRGENVLLPHYCAVKVFRKEAEEFYKNNRDDDGYTLKGDFRSGENYGFRTQPPLLAEKEARYLKRLNDAEIPCPKVFYSRHNILVVEYLGNDDQSAPTLKNVAFDQLDNGAELLSRAYQQCLLMMETLYQKCNLVHGDLSEYNILWYRNSCYFIDLSHAIRSDRCDGSTNADKHLLRDCANICAYFRRSGVNDVLEPEEMYSRVKGQ